MPNFIQLTTPLILHADPILPSHAATKQYVDNKRNSVSASAFTTGTISVARMPALTGDVSSVAGSGIISLNANGVASGTYSKVTVDGTGRVTAGGTLAATDIATVSWAKITSGKPTTAVGYGITNLISLSGGTVSGNISSTATPSASLHAVTKSYVDNAITGVVSASLSVGDVIRKTATAAPSGFLRCNGGVVSRTTYASLFSIVGTIYNKAGSNTGAGKPWVMQYDFNKSISTDITGWNSPIALPDAVSNAQVIVTSSRVYLLGGFTNIGGSSTVYTAIILADGTLGTWSTTTSLPATVYDSQAIVIKNRVYLLGGFVNGTHSSAVYTASVNPDGTIGTWTIAPSLPVTVTNTQAIVTSSRVYLLGGIIDGQTQRSNSDVLSSAILPDGTLGTWQIGLNQGGNSNSQAFTTSNRVYQVGGSAQGALTSAVRTADILTDGTIGPWTSFQQGLPGLVLSPQAIVTSSRVYLLGVMINNSNVYINVFTSEVLTDGTLAAWTSVTTLPISITNSQAIVTSSRVYLLGGLINGNNRTSTIYSATFSGGFNDYSNYSTQTTVASTDFTLPDFSSLEKNSLNYFIKT